MPDDPGFVDYLLETAQRDLDWARAVNMGKQWWRGVPVYPEMASERVIQDAIRKLNYASYALH